MPPDRNNESGIYFESLFTATPEFSFAYISKIIFFSQKLDKKYQKESTECN